MHQQTTSSPLSYRLSTFLVTVLLLTWGGCYEEKFSTDPGDQLNFSTDTLSFDTVLTGISTVTRYFKVYNRNDRSLRLDEVKVTGPNATFFHINADGTPGGVVRDLIIHPKDSIYVFVEATIDPDQPESVSPFVLEAEVTFGLNGNEQRVTVIAWGQNANYIPGPDKPNQVLILSCDLGEVTWDDPKPYVLYGALLIDSCTLVLPPGARLYIHGGIANNDLGVYNEGLIYTLPDGKIDVRGTVDKPVIIRDDRIEPDYAGSWSGIRLGQQSGPHHFSHMQLTNGVVGIYADSASSVTIDHCQFSYTDGPGYYGRHAQATISNSLFFENSAQSVALTYGGSYELSYCTLSSFGNAKESILLNNFYCNDPLCSEGLFLNDLNALVRNCILVGSNSDEVWMVDAAQGMDLFHVAMNHNIVVVDELLKANAFPDFLTDICLNCLEYHPGDTLFVDRDKDDFHLDTSSIAERLALPIPGIPDDLDGHIRDANTPDIGCYEFKE